MSNDVEAPQNFQERMAARVRESIGDLITDAELKILVEKATHDAFFKERTVNPGSYNQTTRPPFFVELIEKEMQARVRESIQAWVAEHPAEITKALDDAIAKGMFELVKQHFENQARGPLFELMSRLSQKGVL